MLKVNNYGSVRSSLAQQDNTENHNYIYIMYCAYVYILLHFWGNNLQIFCENNRHIE